MWRLNPRSEALNAKGLALVSPNLSDLSYWDGDANPVSAVYDDVMLAESFVWCWDARPHPAFPARGDVWADGASWRRGHWLSGRAGLATLADVADALCRRAGIEDAETAQLSGIVAGYIVDAPDTARAALEPLMAAYGFDVREHDGALVFAHGREAEAVTLTLDDLTADVVAEAFQTRADGAEAPIEARVRFLDVSRDYLVGAVSARRRDAAEGGVEMLDAPLVLDEAQAEALAERVLAERRALMEGARIALGPAHLALEPGDHVVLAGETFKIARIEDGHARVLDLARVDANVIAPRDGGEPGAPPDPAHAPTPAFAVLDLPPLPGAEDDDRPLVAVCSRPWAGAHALYAGDDAASATKRADVAEPAIMGELLWDLWPGPVDRWDDGNLTRVKLYAGALASVTKDAALAGANLFAVEGDDGEWELLQARSCVLVGTDAYELSGLLRGLGDSGHAQGAPTPAGRRIVKLDGRLARVAIGAHEWGGTLSFLAPPAGAAVTDAAAAQADHVLAHVALRPFRPAHLRAVRGGDGDVTVTWIRQARVGGLSWAAGEPPIGEPSERYVIEILDGAGDVVRSAEAPVESFSYGVADQTADFGAPPASLRVRIGQIGANGLPALKTESLIPL